MPKKQTEFLALTLDGAQKALPELETKAAQALEQWHALRKQIYALKSFVQAFSRPDAVSSGPTAPALEGKSPGGRAPKGLVYQHVEEVLQAGKGHTQAELKEEIKRQFKIEYGNTSIYRALLKGKDSAKYSVKNGVWHAKGSHAGDASRTDRSPLEP